MAKRVDFAHKDGAVLYARVDKMKKEYLVGPTPRVFDTEYDGQPEIGVTDVLGMIFPDGDVNKKPLLYIRHADMKKNQYRFGNILELGDDWLGTQKALHSDVIGQAGTPISGYQEYEDGVFGFDEIGGRASFRIDENGFHVNEQDILTMDFDNWPNAILESESLYNNVSTLIQPGSFKGTYEGRPVLGLGEHDRSLVSQKVRNFDGITNDFGYIYMNMMGIREDDGRREQAIISIDPFHGKNFCYYWKEGEVPIFTDKVSMEADWKRLPYVDDGTCVYKDAIFRFAGKEFHFEGKWGTKGFTIKPRIEKHGQSQIFGTWYEGKTPYRHRLYMTFGENMEVYDYRLRELGFDVID